MTMQEIKRHNIEAGYYFFYKDNMKFFKSKIYTKVYEIQGRFLFITSEENWNGKKRFFSIREYYKKTGAVKTVCFQITEDFEEAKKMIKEITMANDKFVFRGETL
jgi:hypothetical protein